MADDRENKELSSFKFKKGFKRDLKTAAKVEKISVTTLIEREMNRYLRAFKSAAMEMRRQKEIKDRINELKR